VRSTSLRRAAPLLPLGGRAGIIMTEIFPGGRLPSVPMVEEKATHAGFNPTKLQEIGPHYVKTLKIWADALEAHRKEAIAIQAKRSTTATTSTSTAASGISAKATSACISSRCRSNQTPAVGLGQCRSSDG
jgi:cyclopropane fatty-acyl-phospholipid synthase-like methyltransferase